MVHACRFDKVLNLNPFHYQSNPEHGRQHAFTHPFHTQAHTHIHKHTQSTLHMMLVVVVLADSIVLFVRASCLLKGCSLSYLFTHVIAFLASFFLCFSNDFRNLLLDTVVVSCVVIVTPFCSGSRGHSLSVCESHCGCTTID